MNEAIFRSSAAAGLFFRSLSFFLKSLLFLTPPLRVFFPFQPRYSVGSMTRQTRTGNREASETVLRFTGLRLFPNVLNIWT